jgi:lipooligosaccharide transport system permease protein
VVVAGRVLAVVGWHAYGYRRMWRGTVTVSFVNPLLFLVSLGVLLGALVDENEADLGGLTYLEFVAPALIATTAMQTAASAATYPVKAGLKWWRTYHAVVATPVRVGELVAGVLGWAGVRIIVAAGIFTAVAAAAGAFVSPLAALAPGAALLCGLAFAALLAFVCARVDDDEWLAAIYRFGLVPLFLFSGTFFPVDQLPAWLQPAAWLTPLWHGVELCRELCTGEIDAVSTTGHVLYLLLLTAVCSALAARACSRTLRR